MEVVRCDVTCRSSPSGKSWLRVKRRTWSWRKRRRRMLQLEPVLQKRSSPEPPVLTTVNKTRGV